MTAIRAFSTIASTQQNFKNYLDKAYEPPLVKVNAPTGTLTPSSASILKFKTEGKNQQSVSPSKLLAEWQGRVISVYDDYFIAELTGVFGDEVKGSLEEAHIPISDVMDGDKPLLRSGAFFRLCISYVTLPNRRSARCTTVVFRRMPAYLAHELDAADERARELEGLIRVE